MRTCDAIDSLDGNFSCNIIIIIIFMAGKYTIINLRNKYEIVKRQIPSAVPAVVR